MTAIAPDDRLVRDLHYRTADRARTAKDNPRPGILPADIRRAARRVGTSHDITVYLAQRAGFHCLGVDAANVLDDSVEQAPSTCQLNFNIVNHGLTFTLQPKGTDERVLVVAVPDRTTLLTEPTTPHLADYPNVAVLRPSGDPVYLQPPGHPRIRVSDADSTPGICARVR